MELALDSSTATASLALSRKGRVVAELTWATGQNHTREMLPAMDYLLGQARVGKDVLSAIIVARGPGSFNGLRVGLALAKGLAHALNIPMVGLSTLEVAAWPHLEAGLPVCPIQAVGRGEVAAALFQRHGEQFQRLWEEQILSLDELERRISQETLFCGEIWPDLVPLLKDKLELKARLASPASCLRRAGFLAELGWTRLDRGERDDVATLQPLYLRRPPITLPRTSF